MPAESVGWVTWQAAAARAKWRSRASAVRYCRCLSSMVFGNHTGPGWPGNAGPSRSGYVPPARSSLAVSPRSSSAAAALIRATLACRQSGAAAPRKSRRLRSRTTRPLA